jgi:ABC-type branched-subunit amino acid transport system substrate-binding protein
MKRRTTTWMWTLCLLLGSCAWPASTKPVIKIGLVAPFEGRYRALGYEALYAVKWVVRQRNEAGGVAGHMIELVALNDDNHPDRSAFQARKFDVDAKVMGVIGPFSETTLAAAAPVYRALGLPVISPALCAAYDRNNSAFCLAADGDTLADALLANMPPDVHPVLLRAQRGPFGEALALSTQWVIDAPWEEKELVWRLDKSRTRPPDLYLYDGDVLTATALLTEMRAIGVDAPLWGGPSLARAQLSQIAGEAASGVCYVMTGPAWADLSPGSAFSDGYRALSGSDPGPWAALAYDGAELLLSALERDITDAGGEPSRAGVQRQLQDSLGTDGALVFENGQRRLAEAVVYCYDASEGYPGHIVSE